MERTKSRKFIAEKIRSQYIDDGSKNPFDNLAKLQNLDRRVKRVPKVACIILCSIELVHLIINVWFTVMISITGNFFSLIANELTSTILTACIIGIILDIILLISNYPIYKFWYRKRHTQYADEIIALSDLILGEIDFTVNISNDNEPTSAEIAIIAGKSLENPKFITESKRQQVYEDEEISPESMNDIQES